jgi:hypothetical protein
MWFRSLFDALLARPSSTPARLKRLGPSIRRPRAVRPLLDMLEDRTLLSTYVVDALTDTGAGSGPTGDLRYCVTSATSGNDSITFAPGLTGTIQLQSALPALNASVAIQGPGANLITVDGTSYSGIFTVGSAAAVEISGLTLSNAAQSAITNAGTLSVSATTYNRNMGGGAITNSGTATVSDSTFSQNSGVSGGAIGNYGTMTISYSTLSENFGHSSSGAIYNNGALTINNSTLVRNEVASSVPQTGSGTSAQGGAIYMGGGTLSIRSSTIDNNTAVGTPATSGSTPSGYRWSTPAGSGYGGGLYVAGGSVTIDHSTLADNRVYGGTGGGIGDGGAIFSTVDPGALQVYDTILADNTATDDAPELEGSVTSLGHNLVDDPTGSSGFVASDLLNVNAQLGLLQNNGGPTQTMALLPGSPAIDAGDNTNAPAYDQRGPGFPRIVNGTIDIGAFEVQNGSPTPVSSLAVSSFPSSIQAGSSGSFVVTALNADGSIDTGYTGTVVFTSSDARAALPAAFTFTAADAGSHTFTATLFSAGTQSITATDPTTSGFSGTDTGITVTPAGAHQVAFAQQPSTTTAGRDINPAVAVDVLDEYGNLVGGDSSTVSLTLSGGIFASGSATATAAASGGVATFGTLAIDTAGSYSVTATDGTLTPAGSVSFTVNPAAASKLVVSGFPTPTTAGASHPFAVTAEDAYGNVATGYTGTVHFTSSDHKAVLPADYTFSAADAGAHTFSAALKTAGTQSITATDTTNASLTSVDGSITVNPAAASQFVLTAPASANAGAAFSLTLTVEDAYGNVVTGYTGTIRFSSRDNRATLPANYTFTPANSGVHTFTGLILRKKGMQTITITDTHNSALTGSDIVDVL